jgi:hypothetical protein
MAANGVEYQKQKLLAKTDPEVTYRRMVAVSEVLNLDLFWNNMIRLLAGLLTASDFGVGLTDFYLFHANFRIRLPTLEELLRGIYIALEEVPLEWDFSEYVGLDLGLYFDPSWKLDYPNTLLWFFKTWMYPGIASPYVNLRIAYFDVTKYGEGVYYTPGAPPPPGAPVGALGANPVLAPEQTSSVLSLTQKLSVTPWVVAQYAVMFGNYQLGKAYAMRVDFLESVLGDAFFLGFGMLGYTPIRSKEVRDGQEGVTVHLRVDGKDVGIFVNSLDKVTYGFILGVTPLGLGRFTPPEAFTIFRNTAARYAWWRAMKQKELFVSPVSALVFTVPPEQRESVPKSPRVSVYGVHRHAQEQLRDLVRRVVPDARARADAFTQNMYFIAALDLVYKDRVSHKRIRNWKNIVSDEEYRRLWLEKWQAMGLNTSTLEALYEALRAWEKPLLAEKVRKSLAP